MLLNFFIIIIIVLYGFMFKKHLDLIYLFLLFFSFF